jgi:hypothetical protein
MALIALSAPLGLWQLRPPALVWTSLVLELGAAIAPVGVAAKLARSVSVAPLEVESKRRHGTHS